MHSERWPPLPLCLHKCSKKVFPPKKEEYIFFTRSSRPSSPSFCPKQFRLQLLDCRPVEWGIRAADRAHPRLRLAPDEMRGPSFLVKSSDLPCTYCSCPSTHFPFPADGAKASHLCKQASTIRPVLLSRCYWRPSAFSVFGDSFSCALEVGVEGKGGERPSSSLVALVTFLPPLPFRVFCRSLLPPSVLASCSFLLLPRRLKGNPDWKGREERRRMVPNSPTLPPQGIRPRASGGGGGVSSQDPFLH